MTLSEAVKLFEANFTCHDEAGFKVGAYDGPRDMYRAPTGERYVTITSGGMGRIGAFYADPEDAVSAWLTEAKIYAGDDAERRHLYWRIRPQLVPISFIQIDQAAAMQHEWLRDAVAVDLHFVASRLLVSSKAPDEIATPTRKISL